MFRRHPDDVVAYHGALYSFFRWRWGMSPQADCPQRRLVSRVEGLIYFFRHSFRDFTHYDDVQVGFQKVQGAHWSLYCQSDVDTAQQKLLI